MPTITDRLVDSGVPRIPSPWFLVCKDSVQGQPKEFKAIERQIRPIAIGRHNWLLASCHDGAERAAIFYSLINTRKLQKINPWDYLCDARYSHPTKLRSKAFYPFAGSSSTSFFARYFMHFYTWAYLGGRGPLLLKENPCCWHAPVLKHSINPFAIYGDDLTET